MALYNEFEITKNYKTGSYSATFSRVVSAADIAEYAVCELDELVELGKDPVPYGGKDIRGSIEPQEPERVFCLKNSVGIQYFGLVEIKDC